MKIRRLLAKTWWYIWYPIFCITLDLSFPTIGSNDWKEKLYSWWCNFTLREWWEDGKI